MYSSSRMCSESMAVRSITQICRVLHKAVKMTDGVQLVANMVTSLFVHYAGGRNSEENVLSCDFHVKNCPRDLTTNEHT